MTQLQMKYWRPSCSTERSKAYLQLANTLQIVLIRRCTLLEKTLTSKLLSSRVHRSPSMPPIARMKEQMNLRAPPSCSRPMTFRRDVLWELVQLPAHFKMRRSRLSSGAPRWRLALRRVFTDAAEQVSCLEAIIYTDDELALGENGPDSFWGTVMLPVSLRYAARRILHYCPVPSHLKYYIVSSTWTSRALT